MARSQLVFLSVATLTLAVAVVGCSKSSVADLDASSGTKEKEPLSGSAAKTASAESASTAPSESAEPAEPGSLRIGSKAPEVRLASWVQGEPVEEFQPGHTYVVEFWATWCGPCRAGMPHISKLQEQHAGDVTFIGVTREDESTVTTFLDKTQNEESGATWKEVVTYALALDDNDATSQAYMRAAEKNGIPTAFVVGPDGHIEWIGHPAGIDEPLEEIVAGSWDRDEFLVRYEEQEQQAKEMRAAMMTIREAQQSQDWEKALGAVDQLLEQQPDHPGFATFKFSLQLQAEQFEEAIAQAEQLGKRFDDNANQLNALAWSLASNDSVPDSGLEAALKLAQRASELHEDKDPATLDTLAKVHHRMGDLDRAIALQQQAVELGEDMEELGETLQSYLEERDGEAPTDEAASESDAAKSEATKAEEL